MKYVLAMHVTQPIVNENVLSLGLSHLEDKLSKIYEEYDLSPEIVGDNSFLNINYWGRPTSIIRLSLSEARVQGKQTLDFDTIAREYDSYKKNFDNLFETYQDIFPNVSPNDRELLLQKLSLTERRVFREIEKLQQCTFLELKIILNLSDLDIQASLETLKSKGLVLLSKAGNL